MKHTATLSRLLGGLALATLLACAPPPITTPRSRVAQDIGCTTEGTSVKHIEPIEGEKSARWRVTGCGRAAVYVCTTPVRDCWREGEVQPAPEAP